MKKTAWHVPDRDTKTQALSKMQVEHAEYYARLLPHHSRNVVLQAGGHVGVFPVVLSDTFQDVHTFEPDKENFDCLVANCINFDNIRYSNKALGAEIGLRWVAHCLENSGESYVVDEMPTEHVIPAGYKPGCVVDVVTIDSLQLKELSMLILDLEGYELYALRGARETIAAHHPFITLELNERADKYVKNAHAILRAELGSFGYKELSQYGRDTVFVWRNMP